MSERPARIKLSPTVPSTRVEEAPFTPPSVMLRPPDEHRGAVHAATARRRSRRGTDAPCTPRQRGALHAAFAVSSSTAEAMGTNDPSASSSKASSASPCAMGTGGEV